MKRRLPVALVAALIAFHFFVLSWGMLEPDGTKPIPYLSEAKLWYTRLTGAGAGFGFFSPNVGNEVRIRFEIKRQDGSVEHLALQDLGNEETNARVGNMIRLIAKSFDKDKVVRSVAASFAAYIFHSRPDAKSVKLTTLIYNLPDHRSFHAGARPYEKQIYSATFEVDRP